MLFCTRDQSYYSTVQYTCWGSVALGNDGGKRRAGVGWYYECLVYEYFEVCK